jgi:hypothetical protein
MLHYVKILTFITIQKNNVPLAPPELQEDEDNEAMMGELAIVDSHHHQQQLIDNNANVILVLPTDQKCDNCRNQQESMKQVVEAAAKETKNENEKKNMSSFTNEERFVMNLLKHQPGLKILELLPPSQQLKSVTNSDSKIVKECLDQVIQRIVEDEEKSASTKIEE